MGEEKKDYLSSLIDDDETTLESFQEEKVEHIEKPKRHIKKSVWVTLAILLVVALGAIYWFFLAPKIEMPNFVGKKVGDVSAWVSQYEIEKSKVAMTEEYSLEYDKDVIISQSVDEGKKIKKSTPLNFVVSKGADPDESIEVPDLESMSEDEIRTWISDNKLSKTKVNQQYSSTVEKGVVISVDFSKSDRENFTRASSLIINVSRGPEPAGTVSVQDFVNKTYSEVEAWAKQKKVEVEKVEAFSDSIVAGNVISQSIASGELLKADEKLTVTVSKGKGVTIPNLVGYDKVMLETWTAEASKASISIVKREVYNEAAEGSVVGQDVKAGTQLGNGDVLVLTVSKYLPILNKESSRQFIGSDYVAIQRWADEVNGAGANIQTGEYAGMLNYECSNEFTTPGQIINYWCTAIDGTELSHGCDRPLPLDARVGLTVSTGACEVKATPTPKPEVTEVSVDAGLMVTADDLIAWGSMNNVTFTKQEVEGIQGNYEILDSTYKPVIPNEDKKYTFKIGATYIVKTKVENPSASGNTGKTEGN